MNHTATSVAVVLLIIASVVLLFCESIFADRVWVYWIVVAGDAITFLFIIELAARYYGEADRRRFFARHWIDVLAVLPLAPFRVLRVLRVLRIFQAINLLSRSNRKIRGVFRQSLGTQLRVLIVMVTMILVVAMALVAVEGKNGPPDFQDINGALWWSFLSMIAGEPMGAMPESIVGRFLTAIVMIGGLTVFAFLTGTVSALMIEQFQTALGSDQMDLDKLDGHILICGWNRSAPVVLEEFETSDETEGVPVVVVAEIKPKGFDALAAKFPNVEFILGDYTRMEILKNAGVERASRAILLADKSKIDRSDQDRDARTVLAALMIEKLHHGIFTCAELLLRDNVELLRHAGVEEVIVGDEYSGVMLAASARIRGVVEIAAEIFSNQTRNKLFKCDLPPNWDGEYFVTVAGRIHTRHHAILIAVERAGGPGDAPTAPGQPTPSTRRTETNPPADMVLRKGDRLIVIGEKKPPF